MLISLLLVNWNLLPLPLLYLSAYFEHHRQDYYDLLLAVSERGAWRDWVMFFSRGVAEQAIDANNRAKRLQDLQIEWRQQLIKARASASCLHLADSLFESPMLSISKAQQILGVTYHSAQHSVERLVKAGVLRQRGETAYGKTFVADEILRAVGEAEA